MPKKKAKAKAGKKVIQKQKQTVIVNVTKRGGGKSKGRASAPRPQQIPQVIFQQPQQQFPQYERPQERPHTNERERSHVDEILNVVQRANNIYRQQPPPQAITTTNVDVGQILTGGAAVLKTGLDIYRNYSRGQQEQKQEQQREERRVEVPRANQSDIPARPAIPPRPVRPIPVPAQPQTPRRVIPPVPVFPPTPAKAPAEQILKPAPTPNLPRRQPVRSFKPELPRSSSTGGIRKKDISDLEMKRRLEVLNPNLVRPPAPAPSLPTPSLPAPSPARPSFHIKNILGQIEFKGAMSSARQELKHGQEIRRKANEMPPLEKISLGQMGARSILGSAQKDNFDFQKRASQLRREGIKMRQEGLANIRQTSKSAPASREKPSGPPIGGKRKGY